MSKVYPTLEILELACAAQRANGTYQKSAEATHDQDGRFLFVKQTNKMMMLCTLDHKHWTADPKDAPMPLKVSQEDKSLAQDIRAFYRKLSFAAIEGANDFHTNLYTYLYSDELDPKFIGYIACLPSLYARDLMSSNVKKASKVVDEGWLGSIGEVLLDLDCEVLSCVHSKNFDAWNIDAKINNKLASWMSKNKLEVGPCVLVKAKIKDCGMHWKHDQPVTRLNYVKAAQ